MSLNFKQIKAVSGAKDLINIVLSATQRKTPTVVHPGYNISRIRSFYMRKVKFTQDLFHERLTDITENFPKIEDIHPFYSSLINVLYDKDHYKLALGHVSSCKRMISKIANDYVKLLKYSDSLYRCKQLKKAALGRMCTMIKKLNSSLTYLEEVRKHSSRLPTVDPFQKTLLIVGHPNVGKSSFLNLVTNANVDVQPYPFTTQALYVGHTDFEYNRWQVIDSPGLLDHELDQRNVIEMQTITAISYLNACVLFFLDISEQCGYSIKKQIDGFLKLTPLFQNKPIVIVLTKVDLQKYENLTSEDQALIQELQQKFNSKLCQLSNVSHEGISDVKMQACQQLLEQKQEAQAPTQQPQLFKGVYVAIPKNSAQRQPNIPESVLQKRQLNRPTLKEIQNQFGGSGVYNFPLQEHFVLEQDDWKYDAVPEIMDGKNIFDFVDADILQKLDELEKEEELLAEQRVDEELQPIDEDTLAAHKNIVAKKGLLKLKHRLKRYKTAFPKVVKADEVPEDLAQKIQNRISTKKRKASQQMEIEDAQDLQTLVKKKRMMYSRSRTRQQKQDDQEELPAKTDQEKVVVVTKPKKGKFLEKSRKIDIKYPKHLFQGKTSFSRNRR